MEHTRQPSKDMKKVFNPHLKGNAKSNKGEMSKMEETSSKIMDKTVSLYIYTNNYFIENYNRTK